MGARGGSTERPTRRSLSSLTKPKKLGTTAVALCGVSAFLASYATLPSASASPASSSLLPQVTVLFSRSEITAEDGNCQTDDAGIARLDTVVAPYMASLGLTGTGSIETQPTQQSSEWCAHYGETAAPSWDDLTSLATTENWRFVSHSATYPHKSDWSAMSSAQVYDETCGSAQTITAHNLVGSQGLFAWPDSWVAPDAEADVAQCFDTGRIYGKGLTSAQQVTTPPYLQSTRSVDGGSCIAALPTCSNTGTVTETPPGLLIKRIKNLAPGQWYTMQFYLLVTGTNPAYTTNNTRWDCTATNPQLHWSNDAERYCYSDFQEVMQYLSEQQAAGKVVVNDPGSVANLFGRSVAAVPTAGRASSSRNPEGSAPAPGVNSGPSASQQTRSRPEKTVFLSRPFAESSEDGPFEPTRRRDHLR